MLPSTQPFIQTGIIWFCASEVLVQGYAAGTFFIKILKVLNSPRSFYFSSTLEGVKQPVCAPPSLGCNPALLQRRVCVSVCLSSCVWWEGEVLSLKACRLLFRWKSTQATASEITCHSNCAVRPERVRERGYGRDGWREYVCRRGGEGVMGADGNGATVAELRLIAALDKESIW